MGHRHEVAELVHFHNRFLSNSLERSISLIPAASLSCKNHRGGSRAPIEVLCRARALTGHAAVPERHESMKENSQFGLKGRFDQPRPKAWENTVVKPIGPE